MIAILVTPVSNPPTQNKSGEAVPKAARHKVRINKHNIELVLQRCDAELCEEIEKSVNKCDVYLTEEFEKDKDFHDFRMMPRMIKMMKSSMKRLQVGPKNAKKKVEQKSLAGNNLRKLITKLTNEIPEMKI